MAENHRKLGLGVFPSREVTEQAVNDLKASGFPMDKVSLIGKQAEEGEQVAGVTTSDRIEGQNVETTTGVVADALATATWGTTLVGLSSLAIPGVGPVIAAGSVGAALVTVVAGSGLGTVATRNLVRAISDLGIPEAQASVYSNRLIKGDYLAIVDGTEEEMHQAETLLSQAGIQAWGIYDPA